MRRAFEILPHYALIIGSVGTALLLAGCNGPTPANGSESSAQVTVQPSAQPTQPGSEFLGVWFSDGMTGGVPFHQSVRISPAGAAYLIVFDSGNMSGANAGVQTYPATYENGLLRSSVAGDVAYLPQQQSIMFLGGTLVKTTEEAENNSKAAFLNKLRQIEAQKQAQQAANDQRNRDAIAECRRLNPTKICF